MEQAPLPANVVESITSFQLHRNLNLPPGYGFHASDEQLLQLFLGPFVDGRDQKTCPIHNITGDVYSSSPDVLTGKSFLDETPSFLDEKRSFRLDFLMMSNQH